MSLFILSFLSSCGDSGDDKVSKGHRDAIKIQCEESSNVKVYNNVKTKEIKGKNFVTDLIYEDKDDNEKTISVQGIFIEIGYEPKADFEKLTKKI